MVPFVIIYEVDLADWRVIWIRLILYFDSPSTCAVKAYGNLHNTSDMSIYKQALATQCTKVTIY